MRIYPTFSSAIGAVAQGLRYSSHLVHTEKWQGMEIGEKPEMATYELLNYSFQVPLQPDWGLPAYRNDIKPNLPWADNHFLERVGGEPLNPGVQWEHWPYNKSADRFRGKDGEFTHTYMERYWPKNANNKVPTIHGIRFAYGDLTDVVRLLKEQPLTRQAYLPVWFPEDTGAVHGGRLPCTLGYHFIIRSGFLHIIYYLRSCDFIRHFRDDIYLTVRLLLWMMEQLSEEQPLLKPGTYTMHVTSMHMFKADFVPTFGRPHGSA